MIKLPSLYFLSDVDGNLFVYTKDKVFDFLDVVQDRNYIDYIEHCTCRERSESHLKWMREEGYETHGILHERLRNKEFWQDVFTVEYKAI